MTVPPQGKVSLFDWLSQIGAHNKLTWELESGLGGTDKLLVLRGSCPQDLVPYVPCTWSLRGRQLYLLLRFLESLSPDQVTSLSTGALDLSGLNDVATRSRLRDLILNLPTDQVRALGLYGDEDADPRHSGVERTLVGIRVIPFVRIAAHSQEWTLPLIAFESAIYETVVGKAGDTLVWESANGVRSEGTARRILGLSNTLLPKPLTEVTLYQVPVTGWVTLKSVFENKGKDAEKTVFARQLNSAQVWLTKGSYRVGRLRLAVLRSLCLSLRELRPDAGTSLYFIAPLRIASSWESTSEEGRLSSVLRAFSEWNAGYLGRLLPDSRFPSLRSLWQSDMTFDRLTSEEQTFIAQRWLDCCRSSFSQKVLPQSENVLVTPRQWLLASEARVSLRPRVLFTIGRYVRAADGGMDRYLCVWETKLVI